MSTCEVIIKVNAEGLANKGLTEFYCEIGSNGLLNGYTAEGILATVPFENFSLVDGWYYCSTLLEDYDAASNLRCYVFLRDSTGNLVTFCRWRSMVENGSVENVFNFSEFGSISVGEQPISKVHIGRTELRAVYKGNSQLYVGGDLTGAISSNAAVITDLPFRDMRTGHWVTLKGNITLTMPSSMLLLSPEVTTDNGISVSFKGSITKNDTMCIIPIIDEDGAYLMYYTIEGDTNFIPDSNYAPIKLTAGSQVFKTVFKTCTVNESFEKW